MHHDGAKQTNALAGTTRALVNNMVVGVSQGFEKRLLLQGVGYRAAVKGNVLNLALGFSHPVDYELPEGITAECASQTEVILRGIDKQAVGQVVAEVRGFVHQSHIKAKVFVMLMKLFAVKKLRKVVGKHS